jgi:hypothetical protein
VKKNTINLGALTLTVILCSALSLSASAWDPLLSEESGDVGAMIDARYLDCYRHYFDSCFSGGNQAQQGATLENSIREYQDPFLQAHKKFVQLTSWQNIIAALPRLSEEEQLYAVMRAEMMSVHLPKEHAWIKQVVAVGLTGGLILDFKCLQGLDARQKTIQSLLDCAVVAIDSGIVHPYLVCKNLGDYTKPRILSFALKRLTISNTDAALNTSGLIVPNAVLVSLQSCKLGTLCDLYVPALIRLDVQGNKLKESEVETFLRKYKSIRDIEIHTRQSLAECSIQ